MQITNPRYCIEVNNVSFGYDGNSILEDITFSVTEGEYLGIIGPNGGGKTTLIKIILGLLKPSSGEVKIYGQNVNQYKEKSFIGYVPQRVSNAILHHFPATVEEIILSGRTARIGLLKPIAPEDKEAAWKAMSIADVTQYGNRRIDDLSGGERQRVFIARALAGDPKILILDEPSVGVDISAQEQFYAFIENLNQTFGLTIIFISHDIDVVAHEVKCLLCLNKNLVCHGVPKEFIKEEYLQKLYGKKVKFILHGH